jgi:hypothetical protein
MNTQFFTYRDNKEGNVAIGKLPEKLINILDTITIDIPENEKQKSTYHSWYDNMTPLIKEKIELIKNDEYWKQLNDDKKGIQINMSKMDELYFSNPPPNMENKNLYGASGNFDIHRDCILFQFKGIKFYRVLIGLTDGNSNIITHFNHYNAGHKINKNDYIVFDFNRTTHQVIKEPGQNVSRLMLKLHFLICDDSSKYSTNYIEFIKQIYIYYEYIFRYINDTGTDPESYYEFFVGILYQYGMSPHSLQVLITMMVCITFIKNMYLFLFFGYLINVFCYWMRYNLYKIR